jgi:MEMO1 family protein
MRKAKFASSFYLQDKTQLEKMISEFLSKNNSKKSKKIKACIVPHAGYVFSGKLAGNVYSQIKEKPDTIILLGANHIGTESGFAVSSQDFETPLGIIRNDIEFTSKLLSESKKKSFNLDETKRDKIAHQEEHSIEVQLPFLQYLFPNAKIVPIICQAEENINAIKELAELIFGISIKLKRKILVIASSDFTHYGDSFNFFPFIDNIKENLHKLDRKAIDSILKFNTKEFFVNSNKTTICGVGAIGLCIELARVLNCKKSELVDYYTSGDITKDWNNCVSYAGIVFY